MQKTTELKAKQADMTSSIATMQTEVLRHKDTAAELTQQCAATAATLTDQRRPLNTRTTDLDAAFHFPQAVNASLLKIQGQVETITRM